MEGSKSIASTQEWCKAYTTFKKARLSGGILIRRTEARLVGHTRDCASMNMAGASSSCVLSEEDIPGASLNGRKPAELKNDDLKFWLKCRGDSAKGLKTNRAGDD